MSVNISENHTQNEDQAKKRSAFSLPKLFFINLPAVLLPLALFCALLLLLAWLGLFGSTVSGIVRSNGFFTNPIAYIMYIILGASLAITSAVAFAMGKLSDHRQMIITEAVEKLESGSFNRQNSDKLYSVDREFYSQLERIASNQTDADALNVRLANAASAAKADRDQLSFNILAAKASPAMLKRVMAYTEQMAKEGRSEDIVRVNRLLSTIMSSILADSRRLVSMASELSLVKTLLEMDEIVSGEKTLFRMSIMCNIVDYKLLPNVILPIVSNFLEHARKGNRVGKYEISLELTNIKHRMLLILRDNGIGIDADALAELRRQLDNDEFDMLESDVTLPNISHRLKLQYGDEYGVKVSSSRLGTVVKLYLPVPTNESVAS